VFTKRLGFGRVAQPNGSRLSCGALKKNHFLIYARRQLQALLGSPRLYQPRASNGDSSGSAHGPRHRLAALQRLILQIIEGAGAVSALVDGRNESQAFAADLDRTHLGAPLNIGPRSKPNAGEERITYVEVVVLDGVARTGCFRVSAFRSAVPIASSVAS